MFCFCMRMGIFNLFASALFQLLLNVSICLYTLHYGKQFCSYLSASCQWICAPFIASDTKVCAVACCLYLVQTCSGAVICTPWSLVEDSWTILAACHCLTLSYSVPKCQHCCQSYNKNIPILALLFKSPLYISWSLRFGSCPFIPIFLKSTNYDSNESKQHFTGV